MLEQFLYCDKSCLPLLPPLGRFSMGSACCRFTQAPQPPLGGLASLRLPLKLTIPIPLLLGFLLI